MKTSFYALTAAIAFATAASATAAPQAGADSAASTDSVQVSTARPHTLLLPQDFQQYANAYELETGQVITFSRAGHHYYATLDNEAPAEIFPSSHNGFTTANGVQVKFSEYRDRIAISNFERLPMTVAIAPTGRVIAG